MPPMTIPEALQLALQQYQAGRLPPAETICRQVLAHHPDLVQRFGVLPVVADEKSWSSFRGGYVCVAIPYGGGTTEGSLGL